MNGLQKRLNGIKINNMILFKIITFVLPITIIIFGISKISKQFKNK